MTDPVDRGSETFAEFARAEGFSLSTFYKLKKLGLGPDVLHVPGIKRKTLLAYGGTKYAEAASVGLATLPSASPWADATLCATICLKAPSVFSAGL